MKDEKMVRWLGLIPVLIFFVVMCFARIYIVEKYGAEVPYWDQWDSEADLLFKSWMEGELKIDVLLSGHNEHRILLTRLLALMLFILEGDKWSTLLEMRVNAVLDAAALSYLVWILEKGVKRGWRLICIVATGGVLAIPFGWENVLSGFQSQFYLLLLLSFVYLWGVSSSRPGRTPWVIGIFSGLLLPFTVASGSLSLIIGVIVLGYRILVRREEEISWIYVLILGVVAIVAVVLTPVNPGHEVLKAHSILNFMQSMKQTASWPLPWVGGGILILHAPSMIWLLRTVSDRQALSAWALFVAALLFWLITQYITIAYGRSLIALSSRYLDIFIISAVINIYALGCLLSRDSVSTGLERKALMVIYLSIIFSGVYGRKDEVIGALQDKFLQGQDQIANVRGYLCSGDMHFLKNKSSQSIPYPDPDRLGALLSDKTIRNMLPSILVHECESTF